MSPIAVVFMITELFRLSESFTRLPRVWTARLAGRPAGQPRTPRRLPVSPSVFAARPAVVRPGSRSGGRRLPRRALSSRNNYLQTMVKRNATLGNVFCERNYRPMLIILFVTKNLII